MNAVVGYEEVVDLNNNSGDLGALNGQPNLQRESFTTSEKQEGHVATLEEQESVSNLKKIGAGFSIPLSIFRYRGYGSDFFTSWYNISSEILKEINRSCPEERVLNLALSVLMLPCIAFTALGLVVCSRFKANSKKQEGVGEDKTKKSETGVPKRLAYGVFAAIAIFVNMAVLVALVVPATIALATFYLLNGDLSRSLVTALKISMGRCSNKHQNVEVSFHEKEVAGPNIVWDVEIEFPPQFKRLLRDLCENGNNKWFDVTRDSEHSIVLKLLTNINLKNGLKPLRNEIKEAFATSIQEFAKTMEELMKLEKREVTCDKLKELLDEFRLKVVSSMDSNLTTHLIENAYQVAFIQAIKFQQNKRGEDFLLEDELKNTLMKQKLESRGKELPNEKEIIIKGLREAGAKVPDALDDSDLPVFKAEWEWLIQEGKIAKRTIIDVYRDINLEKTEEALNDAKKRIEDLKKQGQERYTKIYENLKAVYDEGKNNLTNDDLKRKLEGLFKFEYDNQEVERRLVKSVIKRAESQLSQLDIPDKEKQNLGEQLEDLKKEASDKVNDFIAKMYLEVTKCKTQNLFENQAKGIEDSCKLLEKEAPDLVEEINSHRMRIEKYLKIPEQSILLRKIIEGNKVFNKYLKDERNRRGEKHPNTKFMEKHLQNNQEILKALKQLELEKEGLLINKKTTNDYREELESCEKIKFAMIEDKLLERLKEETFNEAEIKKLLEKAELEYCLAEKCMRGPVIEIKNNIKHFCQDLLSPLVNRLVGNIVNNVPKSGEGSWLQPIRAIQTGLGYIKTGLAVAMHGNKSTEGKALSVAHDTHKEVETFLQCFQSNYEGVGAFLGNLFSDDGETFRNDVWPKVEEHLRGMWDRFLKDIEFNIGNRLDEVSVTQQQQETVITA